MGWRDGRGSLGILSVTALVFLLACGGNPEDSEAPSASAEQATADPLGDWRPEFEEMASALDLQGAERQSLEDAFLARDEKLRAWLDGPEGTRLFKLEAELKEAATDRDLGRVRAITDQSDPLRRKFRNLVESTQRDVLDSLSPDNQRLWDVIQLYNRLHELMREVGLSEEQNHRLREGAYDFLLQAHQRGEPNPEAAAFLDYERWAENQVLDTVQRGMYQDIKRENPFRSLR